MSSLSIAHYLPFPRIRILRQQVSGDARKAYLEAVPNKRFSPICHICGKRADRVHSQERRRVRDLDFGPARIWIRCLYRKIACSHCRFFLSSPGDSKTPSGCFPLNIFKVSLIFFFLLGKIRKRVGSSPFSLDISKSPC